MQFALELTPAAALFWLTTLAWLLESRIFPSLAGHEMDGSGRRERLWMSAAIIGGFLLTALCHARGWGNAGDDLAPWLRRAGLFLYASGAVMRYWAAAALGANLTRDVQVISGQTLVTAGPYRWLRHPLYAGLLALGAGLTMLFANLPGPLIAIPMLALAIGARARRETGLLQQKVPEYATWARERWPTVPGLF